MQALHLCTEGTRRLYWANKDHMLPWPGNRLTQGNMLHPWHISIIFTKLNPRWLSTIAGLGCWCGSALLLLPVPLWCWWTRGAEACADASKFWWDFGLTEQLQPPQAAQKGIWEKLVISVQFLSWHEDWQSPARFLSIEISGILTLP